MPKNGASVRCVITGMGVVSPIGFGKKEFAEGILNGRSSYSPILSFSTEGLNSSLASMVGEFSPAEILGKKGIRLLDRTTILSLMASKFALEDSGLDSSAGEEGELGVVLATTAGSLESRKNFFQEALQNGPRAVNPALFPNTVVNSPASQIAIRFGIRGLNSTISAGTASSLLAIEYAARLIENGKAKAILVGGVEELCELSYLRSAKLGWLSGKGGSRGEISAPFDRDRSGTIFGEGAAMLVLESLDSARARGANILAEYRGGASAIDHKAYHCYNKNGDGAKKAFKRTLDRANVDAEGIDFVSSGANGHPDGDLAEAQALSAVLGRDVSGVTVSAVKGAIGESYSASGAFQMASALIGIQHQVVPPTASFAEPSPECPIDVVIGEPRESKIDQVMISSVTPCYQNAACILSKV